MSILSILPKPIVWLAQHPVTLSHPVRTAFRWMYWQTRQLLTQSPLKMKFVNRSYLNVYPREGLTGYWYVILPDYDEQMFLLRFLRQEDVFYDVGANAGAFTVLAASVGSKVVSIEPVPQTFERLEANVKLNPHFDSVQTYRFAVGAHSGLMHITTGLGTGNHLVYEPSEASSVEIEVVTLDTIVGMIGKPNFLKIDVEGHELEVIQGAASLLKSETLFGFLIETFRPYNWHLPKLRAMETLLAEHGFLPFDYDAKNNILRALLHPQDGSNNTLYIKDVEVINSRLEKTQP